MFKSPLTSGMVTKTDKIFKRIKGYEGRAKAREEILGIEKLLGTYGGISGPALTAQYRARTEVFDGMKMVYTDLPQLNKCLNQSGRGDYRGNFAKQEDGTYKFYGLSAHGKKNTPVSLGRTRGLDYLVA